MEVYLTTGLSTKQLNVDDTTTTFAGVLNGRYRVYVDPYACNVRITVLRCWIQRNITIRCWYVLLPIRSTTNGSCSWGTHFPTKNRFQNSIWYRANPFHTGTVAPLLRVRSLSLQILTSITEELKSQTSCNQYNITSVNWRGRKTLFF